MERDEHYDPGEGMVLPASRLGGGSYRECLKNHAVGIGGHAVDGCGEFLPAGEDGTLDALRCAACGCHRNFHRKESPEGSGGGGGGPSSFPPYYRTPAGYFNLHRYAHPLMASAPRAPAPLALPSTSGGEGGALSRGEDDELSDPAMTGSGAGMGMAGIWSTSGGGGGKKRFKTKFTQEQKEMMAAFAERVGWRFQKQDEAAVQQFCNETAIRRHVLKVWMHNNKHSLVIKREPPLMGSQGLSSDQLLARASPSTSAINVPRETC